MLAELPTYGDHGNEEELWNPLTNRVVRVFAHSYVIGASGNQIVWQSSAPYCKTGCSVHVLNVRTGSDRTVQLPRGVEATGDAAISPDGSTIALTTALGGAVSYTHLESSAAGSLSVTLKAAAPLRSAATAS